MIFVCVGTKRFQFNRLLKEIDKLITEDIIQDEVFAQIGASTYIPKNYSYKKYLSGEEFRFFQEKADIIITHGGTGSIVGALKLQKQVIAVPRLTKYGEHADDHQLEIVDLFYKKGYIEKVEEISELGNAINKLTKNPITKRFYGEGRIINIIEEFINKSI